MLGLAHLSAILALSTGVMPDETLFSRGKIRAVIRHQEGSLPVKLLIRTTDNPKPEREDWQYIENIQHFPRRIVASPLGRKVTVTLPLGLKRYSQLCSLFQPKPSANTGNGFKVDFSLESCANVYQKSQ